MMGPMGCPEMSVTSRHNIPEEQRPQFFTNKKNKTVTDTVQGWIGATRTEAGPHSDDVHSKGGRRCVHSDLHVQPDRRVCAVLPQWQEDTTSIQASTVSHKDETL